MRSLFVLGVLILVAGIGILLVDINSAEPDCHTNMSGYEICRSASPSMRGLGIGAIGALVLVGTMVGWSTLRPMPESERTR